MHSIWIGIGIHFVPPILENISRVMPLRNECQPISRQKQSNNTNELNAMRFSANATIFPYSAYSFLLFANGNLGVCSKMSLSIWLRAPTQALTLPQNCLVRPFKKTQLIHEFYMLHGFFTNTETGSRTINISTNANTPRYDNKQTIKSKRRKEKEFCLFLNKKFVFLLQILHEDGHKSEWTRQKCLSVHIKLTRFQVDFCSYCYYRC